MLTFYILGIGEVVFDLNTMFINGGIIYARSTTGKRIVMDRFVSYDEYFYEYGYAHLVEYDGEAYDKYISFG